MNKTRAEAVELAKALVGVLKDGKNRYMIAPSFTNLDAVSQIIRGTNIALGAQNMSCEESGAHTGEISPLMLKDFGVEYVILGHSERRHIYGESDALVNKKVKLALKHGFKVILCIGETLDEREAGKADAICESQTRLGLEGVSAEQMADVAIAYEPVWAIGTGKTATPDDAQTVHANVRKVLAKLFGDKVANDTTIQYGGSMNDKNAADLLAKPDIDGGLIGGAALVAEKFTVIAHVN